MFRWFDRFRERGLKGQPKITIVDVLVVIAILMILSAIILPFVASEYTKLKPSPKRPVAATVKMKH